MNTQKIKNSNVQLSFQIPIEEKKILMDFARQTRRSMTQVLRDYIHSIKDDIKYVEEAR